MTEKQIAAELEEIRSGMRFIDLIVYTDFETGEGKLNPKQVEVIRKLLHLFEKLNWPVRFNSYRQTSIDDRDPIRTGADQGTGTPVRIRSCKPEHGDRTYFGVLLGEVALSIGATVDGDGNLTVKRQHYNPAILIPELNTIVYGSESWWGTIESPAELGKLITEETIQNTWYVKVLTALMKPTKKPADEQSGEGS